MSDPLLAPLVVLALGAVSLYVISRLISSNGLMALLTAAVFAVALRRLLLGWTNGLAWTSSQGTAATFVIDDVSRFMGVIVLGLGLLISVYSGRYMSEDKRYRYYYSLVLLMCAGLLAMLCAVDLFTLYLATILASACSYVLVAFRRTTDTAVEAGFKYAIMGSSAAMLILFGLGYVYRQSGSLALTSGAAAMGTWGLFGAVLMMLGYAVKAALVPAHTWLPDAHGRAPSSISALLSGVLIQVNLLVLVRVGLGLGIEPRILGWALVVEGVLNMTVGNSMALVQSYGKRMLAYSSIAQTGYVAAALGLGLISGHVEMLAAAFYLIAAHALLKGLAFLSKGVCHYYMDSTMLSDLDGLMDRAPATTVVFTVALLGLAGVPPLNGFISKWLFLQGGLRQWDWLSGTVVVLFVLNSLLSLGYYVPLVGRLLTHKRIEGPHAPVSAWMLVPMVLMAVMALGMGVWPTPVMAAATKAAASLLALGG